MKPYFPIELTTFRSGGTPLVSTAPSNGLHHFALSSVLAAARPCPRPSVNYRHGLSLRPSAILNDRIAPLDMNLEW